MVIAVCHHRDNREHLERLLLSLRTSYPVMVIENGTEESDFMANPHDGYELGALKKALAMTDDGDIFLLQDTCIIKDSRIFDIAADMPGSAAVCENFQSYLGKYRRSVIGKIGIPEVATKQESIRQEGEWNRKYMAADPDFAYIEPRLRDGSDIRNIGGVMTMVLENDYIIKYKRNWGQF